MTENDGLLGATAQVLLAGGDAQAAALLRDAKELRFKHKYPLYVDPAARKAYLDWAECTVEFTASHAVLHVESWMVERFTDEVKDRVHDALFDTMFGREVWVQSFSVVTADASEDWRDQLDRSLAETPTNQGSVRRRPTDIEHIDGLSFASDGELRLYEAGKRAQEQLSEHENLTLVPRPGARLPAGTREPDLLVVYRGKVAVIEVDGPHHKGKWSNDQSRDRLFEDAGFAYVCHLDVEDTTDPAQLDALFARVLKKLGGRD